MKKKLYGILAFVLVALCALGFAFVFTACSGGGDDEDNNTVVDDDKDPIIGTWTGDVAFHAQWGVLPLDLVADTTIVVDDETFSLTVSIDIMGLMTYEDYTAIDNASWVKDEETGIYHAYATIGDVDYDIPIELILVGENLYEMSLTTEITLSIEGVGDIDATFTDARVRKEGCDYSEDKLFPVVEETEGETEEEATCECGEECTCGENCECDETCECENCGNTSEEGCTCGDDCTCGENCECGEDCTCENCVEEEDE